MNSCQQKKKTRYASGVKLRSSKEKNASGGFSCFAVATFDTKYYTHFKHVCLVGEKQELHTASDSSISFLPNCAWHLGNKWNKSLYLSVNVFSPEH